MSTISYDFCCDNAFDVVYYRRLRNAVEMWISTVWLDSIVDADSHAMAQKFSSSSPRLSLKDIERRASLVLLHSHFSFGNGKSLSPNIVEVGGLAINAPRPLPPVSCVRFLSSRFLAAS